MCSSDLNKINKKKREMIARMGETKLKHNIHRKQKKYSSPLTRTTLSKEGVQVGLNSKISDNGTARNVEISKQEDKNSKFMIEYSSLTKVLILSNTTNSTNHRHKSIKIVQENNRISFKTILFT